MQPFLAAPNVQFARRRGGDVGHHRHVDVFVDFLQRERHDDRSVCRAARQRHDDAVFFADFSGARYETDRHFANFRCEWPEYVEEVFEVAVARKRHQELRTVRIHQNDLAVRIEPNERDRTQVEQLEEVLPLVSFVAGKVDGGLHDAQRRRTTRN